MSKLEEKLAASIKPGQGTKPGKPAGAGAKQAAKASPKPAAKAVAKVAPKVAPMTRQLSPGVAQPRASADANVPDQGASRADLHPRRVWPD